MGISQKTYLTGIRNGVLILWLAVFCFSYTYAQPLNGSYTINKLQAASSTNFISFQSIFNALAARGVNGKVIIDVQNGPYTEQASLDIVPGATFVNTILINGNGQTISYTATIPTEKHTLKINGVDFLTLRNLTIEALGTSQAWGIHYTNNTDNNVLENCIVSIPNFTGIGDGIGIVVAASNTNALTAGSAAKKLQITTCTIKGSANGGAGHGMVINPQATGNIVADISIIHTQIEDFRSSGILITNARGVKVFNCQISRPKRTSVDDTYGIRLVNSIKEDTILANRIFNCYAAATPASKFGRFYGINIDNSLGNILVANNLIYENNNSGLWYGIYMGCSPSTKIVHNTISADNSAATFGVVYGFYHDKATCNNSTGSEFRNNIVSITRGGAELRYGIYQNSGAITIDNNNVFVTGAKAKYGWETSDYATLKDWQAATGPGAPYGQGSAEVDPDYFSLSSGNLFPQAVNIDDIGYAAGLLVDINNTIRSNTLPDPGAYEFTINANVSKIDKRKNNACVGSSDTVKVLISNNSPYSITEFEVGYIFNGGVEVVEPFASTILAGDSAWFSFTTLVNYVNAGNHTIQAHIKGKPLIGPKNVMVNPAPIGFKLQAATNFKGKINGGDKIDPDVVPTTDTSVYEITAPLGYNNIDYGNKWIIREISLPVINSTKTINGADTLVHPANSNTNAQFALKPSSNLVTDTLLASFYVADMQTGCVASPISRYIHIVAKPIASFSFTNVCEGRALQFVNTSIGAGFLGYKWFFGDNDSSIATSPLKLYKNPGNYRVVLYTTSPDGFVDSSVAIVRVYDAPETDFSFINQCEGKPISFTNNSVAHTSIYTQDWDFGDSKGVSTLADPNYLYSNYGFYNVSLTITDGRGCTTTRTKQVTFAQKPTAVFSFPLLTCNQKKVGFTNNTISSGQIGFTWYFGDGDSSNARQVEHLYAQEGSYKVMLVARNGFDCIDTAIKTITLLGTPAIDFLMSNTCANQPILFTNTTIEPLATGVKYFWEFGDAGDTANTQHTEHQYTSVGKRTITLSAFPNNGCDAKLVREVNITEKPLADFVSPPQVCTDKAYIIINNSTLVTGPLNYVWDLGGKKSTQEHPSDTFFIAGHYSVQLIAYSSVGCADTSTKTIEAIATPNSNFIIESRKTGDGVMILTPEEPNGNGNYTWLYGQGLTDTVKTTHQFAFADAGLASVTLRIDNKGCVSITKRSVNINPLSVVDDAAKDKLNIYPNPSAGQFVIQLPNEDKIVGVMIYNSLGQVVFQSQNAIELRKTFPLAIHLANGNYKILVNSLNSVYSAEISIVN